MSEEKRVRFDATKMAGSYLITFGALHNRYVKNKTESTPEMDLRLIKSFIDFIGSLKTEDISIQVAFQILLGQLLDEAKEVPKDIEVLKKTKATKAIDIANSIKSTLNGEKNREINDEDYTHFLNAIRILWLKGDIKYKAEIKKATGQLEDPNLG